MVNLPVPTWAQVTPGVVDTSALWNANVYTNGTFLTTPPLFAGYQSAAQSIANATVTALGIDTTVVDTYGGHSNITNNSRYTAQVAGYYFVIAQVGYAVNATGNRLIEMHKNGGSVLQLGQGVSLAPTVNNNPANQVSALVFLNATDYMEAFTYQTSGGALNTLPSQTGMTVIWIHA